MFEALARVLARFSTRRPWLALVTVLVAVIGVAAQGQPEMSNDDSSAFAPDEPAIVAQRFIADSFEDSGTVTAMQVVFTAVDSRVGDAQGATSSGNVIGVDGLAAVDAAREAIQAAEYEGVRLADLLVDQTGNGPIISYLTPVEFAVAQQGTDPESDDEVRAAFAVGLAEGPPQVAGFVDSLLATDARIDGERSTSGAGLMVAFFRAPDGVEETEVFSELQKQVLDDLDGAAFGAVSAVPFSSELIGVAADAAAIEIPLLLLAALGIIALLLLVAYLPRRPVPMGRRVRRTAADTALTLAVVLLAIVFAQGMAFLLGPGRLDIIGPIGGPSNIVPILLVGLGVDYVIHLNANYRLGLAEGRSAEEAMARSARVVGGALALSSITTIVGFMTNVVSGISGLADFGIYASVGIGASFLISTVLFPAARMLLDRRGGSDVDGTVAADRPGYARKQDGPLDRLVGATSVVAVRFPAATLGVFLALVAGAGVVATNLETRFSFVDFVPENSSVRDGFDDLVSNFGGTVGGSTQLLVRADLADPAVWNAVADAEAGLAEVDGVVFVGGEPQITSPRSLLEAAMIEGGPAYRPEAADLVVAAGLDVELRAPSDADLAPLIDGVGDLFRPVVTDRAFLVTVGTRSGESAEAIRLGDDLEGLFLAALIDATGENSTQDAVVATSQDIIDANVVKAISNVQVQSVILVVIGAALFVGLSFLLTDRRPLLGVVTVAPVGAVVVFLFAFMVLFGIALGPVTATLAAVVIGIGVDYTVHITHRFQDYRREGMPIDDAMTATLSTTGAALVVSAVTTGLGFSVLLLLSLIPFQQFGTLTIVAVVGSALVSVLVLPSLLVLWARFGERRSGVASAEVASTGAAAA